MMELYQLDSLLREGLLRDEKLFLVRSKTDNLQEVDQNYAKKLAIASVFYEQFQLTVMT